jgi:Zn finger protein HypA/HybF involved in hydrogenase expression
MAKTYFEKLKDPRWQKKRLEILERDNWTCKECGSKDKTLHIHHGFYTGGCDPWEYVSSTLHTVCEDCHEQYESIKHDVHLELAKLSIKDMNEVMMYLINRKPKLSRPEFKKGRGGTVLIPRIGELKNPI